MPDFQTTDGLTLHYTDEGAGTPVLCLAGLTRNGSDFDYVAPYLDGVRLIRLDYRGRGKSGWAKDWSTYSIPVEARDVLELMDALALEQVAILGTSRGGLIAMALAATVPDRLLGVCLNDIGPEIAESGLEDIRNYLGVPPTAKTLEAATKMRAALLPGFEDVPEDRWREEVEKHYVETEEGLAFNYDPKLRDAVLEAGAQPVPDLWPLFDALTPLPCCLIRGANSNLLMAETAAEMQKRNPEMIYAEVPKRGHVPFLDEAEALDALNEWLMLL
jgi:pimeloyl-ACP methyl ester carboxylesterase